MYKAIKDNKIIAISDTDKEFKFMVKDAVVEDTEHVAKDYRQYNGEYLLNADVPMETPTRSQMHELRKQAYAETTDKLTLEKLRLQAIGQWTVEKETAYVAEIQLQSAEIKAKYPFSHKRTPADQVGQGQEQEPESIGA